jgi:replicative DNA helicase
MLELAKPQDDLVAGAHREAPHNLQIEQALLGAVLVNNDLLNVINTDLKPESFYAGVHGKIFEVIQRFHNKGQVANPVTLSHYFAQNDEVEDQYLAGLAAAAITVIDAKDYADILIDLAMKRELIRIGEDVVNDAYVADSPHTASEHVEHAEQKLFNLANAGSEQRGFQSIRLGLNDALLRTESAMKQSGSVVGIPTQLNALDRLLGGLSDSDLLILAGRPSMGKTALATSLAYGACKSLQHLAESGGEQKSVGFFSLEMSSEQLANRLLASTTNINSHKLIRGDLSDQEFSDLVQQSNELSRIPFFIDDTPALSIAAVRTRARRLKRLHNLGFLVVDYLQLVRGTGGSASNRVQEISEITQGLKAIAKELNIPVLALSQLSRAVEQREDKRPQLSDLRESGSIEQDADVVMFVYREEYYMARSEPRPDTEEHAAWMAKMEQIHGLADVIVAKQRHGPIGTVTLQFQSEFTRFRDLEREEYVPEGF